MQRRAKDGLTEEKDFEMKWNPKLYSGQKILPAKKMK